MTKALRGPGVPNLIGQEFLHDEKAMDIWKSSTSVRDVWAKPGW